MTPRPASRPRTIVFNGARLEIWTPEHTRVVFADGSSVPATPHDTDEYRERAAALGHRDAGELARCHDFCHLLVGQCLAYGNRTPQYPVLAAIAHGTEHEVPAFVAQGEESMALALARYLTTGDTDAWLTPLVLAGYDLEDLRERARALLDLNQSGETEAT